jgi:hypothetical protein
LEQVFISYRTKRPTNSALWCRVGLARSIKSFIPTRLIPIVTLRNRHKRRPLQRHLVQRRNQISRGNRGLAPMRNAILATRRVVVDSLSVPQLHKVSLIVMLPPRAVRRLNTKTISHHMHRTPVLLELCRRTAHQTSKVSPLRLSPQKLLKTSEVKPKSSSKN